MNTQACISKVLLLTCLLGFPFPAPAQTDATKPGQSASEASDKVRQAELLQAERRAFAMASLTSLAEEARTYPDLAVRARVLARVAETLWVSDSSSSRSLFRRAWDAAELADAQERSGNTKGKPPPIITALRRISGSDLRVEVISLAARRDRLLGEEFLAKLKDEKTVEAKQSGSDAASNDGWSVSEQMTKRLLFADKLLEDGQTELAIEVAAPALTEINVHSITFLSALREKKPDAADSRFAFLLSRAELDPQSDANTVSGLSSYVLTPGFYVTFSSDGGSRWSQPELAVAPPVLSPTLRQKFLQVAAAILLRPVERNQDSGSAGAVGKFQVIQRLLPFFEQNAPDVAAALRAQQTSLNLPKSAMPAGRDGPTGGLDQIRQDDVSSPGVQAQIDRAKTARERDEIWADAAVSLAQTGDARALDFADKIDDSARRSQVRQYVDLQFIQLAIKKKEASEVVRLAKSGQLTHTQRVWAFTQAARLSANSERTLVIELLEEAASEARRIDADDADRARSLIAVATQFVTLDQVRAWELVNETVKAANSAENFTGENEQLSFGLLATRSGIKTINIRADDFTLAGLVRALAEVDLNRTLDVAKSFKNPAPRAATILTMAQTVLNKNASASEAKKL